MEKWLPCAYNTHLVATTLEKSLLQLLVEAGLRESLVKIDIVVTPHLMKEMNSKHFASKWCWWHNVDKRRPIVVGNRREEGVRTQLRMQT